MGRLIHSRAAIALITCAVIFSAWLARQTTVALATSYHTITVNGKLNGDCTLWQSDEKFNGNDGTQTWITWDANNIYVAWLGGGANSEQRVVAFDLDPGTNDGSNINYSNVQFPSSGQPDYIAQVANDHTYFATRTGNSLSNVTDPAGTSNYFSTCSGSNFTELSIARSLFTGGSVSGLAPTAGVGVYSYFVSTTNYVYGGMPAGKVGDGTATQTFTEMEYFPTTDDFRSPSTYGQVLVNPTTGPGDNNIQWDGLFADQSSFFMSPVEVTQGGALTLRFRTYHDDVTSAAVNWYDSANPSGGWDNWIPMSVVGQDATGKYDIWQADASAMLTTNSTKYYQFRLTDQNAVTWYNASGPTCGSNNTEYTCQAPDNESFWVIPGFSTPAWSHDATFYQIFPDRFRNGDTSNDVPFHSSTEVSPDSNSNCPAGSYNYGASCAFTHNSWTQLPAQPSYGTDFFGGDLTGINQEIDPYLKQTLGVNALYLNPIFESPSNHKYDTQDYYTVDPHFGTNTGDGPASLTSLIGTAHSTTDFSGDTRMSVMLDGVFNHTGDWNCWFNHPDFNCGADPGAYQSTSSQYYAWYKFLDPQKDYCAWDGFGSLPQLNYSAPGVRDQIYRSPTSVMQTYLKPPYSIDGWRLDVADNYSDLNNAPSNNPCEIGVDNHQIWQEIRPYVKAANPQGLILGEYWQKPTDWLHGDQWDSVMNYNGFNVPVSRFFTGQNVHGEPDGYLSPSALSAWLNGTLADNPRDSQLSMLNSLTTHDTARFLYRACMSPSINAGNTACLASATTPEAAFAKLKMATELQMTYVGMPSIYYGDEIGMTGNNDPDNRRPFDWNQADWNQDIFNTTRTLVFNRSAHPALRQGSFKTLLTDDTNDVFAYGRFLLDPSTIATGAAPSDAAIVVLNNDTNSHTETIDATQLSLTDGTTLTDIISHQTYTVQNGQISITLAGNTGAVLVMGSPATVPPMASFPSTTPSATTTSLGTDGSPSDINTNVTFTATVSSGDGTPTGTVQFTADGSYIGSPQPLSNGVATYSTNSLSLGQHDITALYIPSTGTDTYEGSTSNDVQQNVENFPKLSLTKSADNGTVSAGSAIGYTITLSNAAGAGTATSPTISDTLPGGDGITWSISPSVTGCSISGTAPHQSLSCSLDDLSAGGSDAVHVTSPTTTASCGTYQNMATAGASNAQSSPSTDEIPINVQCPTQLVYTGTQAVSVSQTMTPSAQVGGNTTCQDSGSVTFTLDRNPSAGSNPFPVMASVSSDNARAATMSASGWTPGVYTLTAVYGGTGACAPSSDTAVITVGTTGAGALGEGRVGGYASGYKFEFAVTPSHGGMLQVMTQNGWELRGSFTAYVRTANNYGGADGTATITNGGIGLSGVRFGISFHGNGSPYVFGIHIDYLPNGSWPAFPNGPPSISSGGTIQVH